MQFNITILKFVVQNKHVLKKTRKPSFGLILNNFQLRYLHWHGLYLKNKQPGAQFRLNHTACSVHVLFLINTRRKINKKLNFICSDIDANLKYGLNENLSLWSGVKGAKFISVILLLLRIKLLGHSFYWTFTLGNC